MQERAREAVTGYLLTPTHDQQIDMRSTECKTSLLLRYLDIDKQAAWIPIWALKQKKWEMCQRVPYYMVLSKGLSESRNLLFGITTLLCSFHNLLSQVWVEGFFRTAFVLRTYVITITLV